MTEKVVNKKDRRKCYMKKIVSLVVTAIMLVSMMGVSANAESVLEAVPVSLPEYVGKLPPVVPQGASHDISCSPGTYAAPLAVDYYVTPGVTSLTIESCTWGPQASDIIVGFYPCIATNPGPFGVRFSGGAITNSTIYTYNVPAGMYWVYVYNAGAFPISGTMNFYISG